MEKNFDVIIVGGGVTGTSLLWALSRYTKIKRVLLLEKYDSIAALNSNSRSNSQTLHFGDIETNYTLEKSRKVKRYAEYLLGYANNVLDKAELRKIVRKCQKMVLGVGYEEVEALERIYASGILDIFPGLKRIENKEIAKIEPNVMAGRNRREDVLALLSDKGYMVDFGRLARTFVQNARKYNKNVEVKTGIAVKSAHRTNDGYIVNAGNETLNSKFVAFATGTYSLHFAKKFGYDENLSILSIGGGFYFSKRLLNGKVYRVQHGHIPFAAIHADPDINNRNVTRFGPTVTVPLTLEKGHPGTMPDYIKSFDIDLQTAISLKRILLNKDILRIIRRNMSYSLPVIGKNLFLKNEASRIIPKIKASDLWLDKSTGGIRPQIIDKTKHFLALGEAKIQREGLIFNITPSPGASSCVGSAMEDAKYIAKYMGTDFNESLFEKDSRA
ncbi:MAG: FAD-dependent oxidoreductase [Candidatus Micrarchaeaceae archaeon]